mmetsp:Transcript_6804/g.9746  ORF Transcript_6804/g.9746 Transcript_6804/m.9746 type:complete len:351 (+) Transcript_6804:61-1113(+)|eukprot:CAMPEP_0202458824 /NCGR_PEP_ID=MMETSP1360-20130828/28539_1 /ASSEMBLY_ACC=CAM_ASM_000848 /TAXON_ID=515479 /ORGANISM="Licmophora paradoxa, Strain CCMP2313" /LENGTH=350 /DNA_ID=CAMNT_0049079555 /DNA_START=73 /DNA_END=1125 /DNA_ORIENTATION=-
MKAVLVSNFGQPNDVMTVGQTQNPNLSQKKKKKKKKELLIEVKACSLSPGDYRTLLGDKTLVCNPTMPYTPGGDVSGIIASVPESLKSKFSKGDKVVATWDICGYGGLAEYALVDANRTVKLPEGLSFEEGAALANTASHAFNILQRAKVKQGDRVLVLGGSGGIGTLLVQMLREQGASYVAATSTDEKLMNELGVDKTINYQENEWAHVREWETNKFDCVIDLAVGVKAWKDCSSVLKGCKQGGRFVSVVFNEWYIDGKRLHKIMGLLLRPLGRQLFNSMRTKSPYYRMYLDEPSLSTMETMLAKAASGEIKTVLDPMSPHPFTTEGVRAAWNHHIAKKGHGKIVIQID